MGLYDALLDHQPVLAIVGQQARNALGGQYQQELDLVSIFQGCCQRLCGASLLSGPGPTFDRSRRPDRAIAPDRDRDHPTQRPVPPHITFQQAKNLSIALAKDDPDEAGVIRGVARQVLETVLPGKE
jgi:hypothetical protein